jgi:hypothetical protein
VNGGDVVRAYVDARTEAGLPSPSRHKAILGRYAKALLAQGWSDEVVLAATKDFAATGRHPRFLEEWVQETQVKWDDIQHAIRKAEERQPVSPEVRAAMAGLVIKRMPDVRPLTDNDLRLVKAGPRCYECALSGRMDNCLNCAYAIDTVADRKKADAIKMATREITR